MVRIQSTGFRNRNDPNFVCHCPWFNHCLPNGFGSKVAAMLFILWLIATPFRTVLVQTMDCNYFAWSKGAIGFNEMIPALMVLHHRSYCKYRLKNFLWVIIISVMSFLFCYYWKVKYQKKLFSVVFMKKK